MVFDDFRKDPGFSPSNGSNTGGCGHINRPTVTYSRVPNRRIDTPIVSVRFFASDTFIIVRLNTDTLIKFPNESRKHADV